MLRLSAQTVSVGHSEYVLIDPVAAPDDTCRVKEDSSPNTEYIVPVDSGSGTIGDSIRLRCSQSGLKKMDPFIKTEFIEEKAPDRHFVYIGGGTGMGSYYYLPYVSAESSVYEGVEHEQIPPGGTGCAPWYPR